MARFSERTLKILADAGWTEGRRIDVSGFEAFYREHNQTISPVVLDFLREFGGLTLITAVITRTSRSGTIHNLTREFIIDPVEAWVFYGRNPLSYYENKVGRTLCIIGELHDESVLMDTSGAVYNVFDRWIGKQGDSGAEAIEAFCNPKLAK